MAHYIDADKAYRDVDVSLSCYYGEHCMLDDVKDFIDEQPIVDVEAVIRCKDCISAQERYGHLECIHGVNYRNT